MTRTRDRISHAAAKLCEDFAARAFGVEVRAGTDANGTPYNTDKRVREIMYAQFNSFMKAVDAALDENNRCVRNDTRTEMQQEFKNLLGIKEPDDETDSY